MQSELIVPSESWIQRIGAVRFAVALCLVVGVISGLISAAVHPAAGFGAVVAFVVGWAMLKRPVYGVVAFVAATYLLPFAVVPLSLGGVRLTLIDFALSGLLLIWVFGLLVRPERGFVTSPADLLIVVFIGLAVTSFVLNVDQVSAEVSRFFLKSINGVLFYYSITNTVRRRDDLVLVVRACILGGGVAGAIAIGLYVLPHPVANGLLNSLHVLGYPTGDVLRYIAGTPTLRAIGTAVDPNVLGGMLILVIPVILAQLFEPKPVLSKRLLAGLGLAAVIALALTYSRGAWSGLVASVLFLATFRYRKLWVLLVACLVVLWFIPAGEAIVDRVESGVTVQDQAAGMRLGEYKDALRLIQQYPWFGVGFGDAPSIDLYIATSSVYLMIAEEMGLVGLSVFLLTVGVATGYAYAGLRRAADPQLRGVQSGMLAAMVAALSAGVFDHYFFNLHFPHTVALFWLVTALGVASSKIGDHEASEAAPAASQQSALPLSSGVGVRR